MPLPPPYRTHPSPRRAPEHPTVLQRAGYAAEQAVALLYFLGMAYGTMRFVDFLTSAL